MTTARRTRVAPGVYQDAYGFGVWASVGSGARRVTAKEERFPPGTPLETMIAAWHRQKAALATVTQTRAVRGTLAADVPRYFTAATLSKQRVQERTQQLDWWVDRFGHRVRATLTADELRFALRTLKKSPSTRNKYRTALSNVFTVLDGKNAPNPFRDIKPEDEAAAVNHAQPYEFIDAVLAQIRNTSHRKGAPPSRTKAFLSCEAYVPITRRQLTQLQPRHVHWAECEVEVPGRHKGQGTRGQRKRISARGMAALRLFDAAGCWGRVPSNSSIYRIFTTAVADAVAEIQANGNPHGIDLVSAATMTPYHLRHSLGTAVVQATKGDLLKAQLMLDHADPRTTLRYVQGAVTDVMRSAGDALAAALDNLPPYVKPTPQVAAKAPRLGKDFQPRLPTTRCLQRSKQVHLLAK